VGVVHPVLRKKRVFQRPHRRLMQLAADEVGVLPRVLRVIVKLVRRLRRLQLVLLLQGLRRRARVVPL
jgi:hypothetical protein